VKGVFLGLGGKAEGESGPEDRGGTCFTKPSRGTVATERPFALAAGAPREKTNNCAQVSSVERYGTTLLLEM
jgi:hypothetical protein